MVTRTLVALFLCIIGTSCFFLKGEHPGTRIPFTINHPPEEQGNGVEGDIIVSHSDDRPPTVSRGKRQTVTDVQRLWPNGIIVYTFDRNWPDCDDARTAKLSIAKAMKHWEDVTCLRFRQKSGNTAREVGHNSFIIFVFGSGCSSFIGRFWESQEGQKIQVGGGCKDAPISIAHELAHAAGFYHEHTRPDRDNYIKINPSNVASDSLQYFEKRMSDNEKTNELYDIESVMHYGPTFFSKNKHFTIEPKNRHLLSAMGQRDYLSFIDIKTMNDVYKCKSSCRTELRCQNGGYIGPKCTCMCPFGLTGKYCTDVSRSLSGCGGVLNKFSGTFTSPNYPNEYPPSTTCTWLIEGPIGSSIKLKFSELDLEVTQFCRQDHVEIKIYGPTLAGPKYCKWSDIQGTFHYPGNALYVKFKSDDIENFYGFNANYTIY